MESNQNELQDDGEMTIVSHLSELRKRLILCLLVIGFFSTISYYFAEEIVHFITAPAGKLYYMHPAEAFFTYLKASFFTGFLISLPFVLYQIWAFLIPALTDDERTAVRFLVPTSCILFFVGLIFSYYFVLPAGIKFFLGFSNVDLQPLFSIGQYLDFVISFLMPFGFIFELPLIILVLAKLGFVSSKYLIKKRKIVILFSFIIGAFISPTPDVFSQTMIAVPILILYEISIIIVKYLLQK